ncbi:MAG TPA: HlyD family efflux transporter periplasmic adaptor subunit, partial [Myxococcota bacterium]|nr:HlyD family efflux transporter periplasmic adaptor subunit [Myxococcota bacterium]
KRRRAAEASVDQRMTECRLSERELERTQALRERDFASERDLDLSRERTEAAHAACAAAEADAESLEAAIEAAQAQAARVETEIRDATLVSPVSGRVQHRLAEPGEVLPAGGRVLTLLDLGDVYMTLFLPEEEAGRVAIGAEARVLLDAQPERWIPARITFVSAEAQFTPKHVETRSEREKLSFRVKAQVIDGSDPALKPGAPGVAWIRFDERAAWPAPKR